MIINYLGAIETLNRDYPWLAQHMQGVHPLTLEGEQHLLGVYTID